ncbi:MAG: calcium-binding protein, partial [Erythrobacter sp.]
MTDITGTQGDDTLDGTSGDDLIRGLGGNDIITGGDGNDTIEGGDGDDNISGGAGDDIIDGGAGRDIIDDFDGNDTVHGGLGNDVIYVGGGTNLIYGDEGDDLIIAQLVNEGVAESEIYAGDGNDEVRYQTVGGFGGSVDLGSGADLLVLGTEMQDLSIALGTGQDTIFLSGLISAAGGSATVTDFEAGDTGDRLDLSRIVQHDLFDYDGYANPFGTGHFTLVASGTGSAIEFRTDINYGPVFTLYFPNVSVGQFTAYNLGGYDPSGVTTDGPPINGTPNADTIDGTDLGETISGLAGDDTINGLGGNDTIIGGAGSDTLNGGDGDDLFIFDFSSEPGFDPSENPSLDAAINGGAGTDTIRVIGSVQGSDIVQFDVAADLPMTSIERLEFDGNSELLGTAAQIAAFEFVAASNLRITDAAHFDPSGGFAVTQLSLSNAGASADLSGPEVYVLNIVTGDGNDNIVGPDQAMTNPDPFNSDITIGIDVRGGDDVVVTGNFATRVLSAGGNNNFTGGTGNDTFILFGNGNNIVNGGAGNDEITFYDLGTSTGHGGDGDDVISIRFLDPTDVLSGGAGTDRMIVDTGGSFDDYDLTGVTLPSDFEIFEVQGQGNIIATTGQINQFDEFIVRYLTIADGGAVTLDHAPFQVHLSAEGNSIDLSGSSSSFTYVYGNLGRDIIIGGQSYNFLSGGAGDDELISFGGDDSLDGGDGVDLIIGGLGNDQIDGGSNVDTAVVSGNRAAYTVTQTSAGVFEVAG